MEIIKHIIEVTIAALLLVAALSLLSGCMPDVPNGAACTPDGFVMTLSEESNPLDWSTWEFVVDEEGAAMQCTFN